MKKISEKLAIKYVPSERQELITKRTSNKRALRIMFLPEFIFPARIMITETNTRESIVINYDKQRGVLGNAYAILDKIDNVIRYGIIVDNTQNKGTLIVLELKDSKKSIINDIKEVLKWQPY